jgi:hypothetical protein
MDKYEKSQRLRQEAARQRIAFIEVDIDAAMTFLRIATADLLDNPERADKLLAKARLAYGATAKFLPDVEDIGQSRRLHDRHQALADAIGELERKRRRER